MSIDPLTAALNLGKSALERIFPDPKDRIEKEMMLMQLAKDGELAKLDAEVKLLLAQIEVNKIEAASDSLFKSGWRPATGWVCVLGLFFAGIVRPILLACGLDVPEIDTGTLLTILLGMLGLSGFRTAEKFKGVAS